MRIKLLFFSALLAMGPGIIQLTAQQAISSAGFEAWSSDGSVSGTIGQVFYTANSGSDGSVSQGVQQANKLYILTGVGDDLNTDFSVSVYPNPTSESVKIDFNSDKNNRYLIQLYDITGSLLTSESTDSRETIINMEKLVAGLYFIKISADNKETKTIKILKK